MSWGVFRRYYIAPPKAVQPSLGTFTNPPKILLPDLYTNSQTFYSATVSPGPVTLTPSLFTNDQTFYSATVTQSQPLSPSLFTNSQDFFELGSEISGDPSYDNAGYWTGANGGWSVTGGQAVGTAAVGFVWKSSFGIVEEGKTYRWEMVVASRTAGSVRAYLGGGPTNYGDSITAAGTYSGYIICPAQGEFGINAPDGFSGAIDSLSIKEVTGPRVTYGLTPGLYTNDQTFYSPTVSTLSTLLPSLYTNDQTFYSPTVTNAGQVLEPSLYTNSQTFYSATVSTTYSLTPSLFTNSQTFYDPTVTSVYGLTPALFTNSQTFYGPTVTSVKTLLPSLFTNTQTFYSPTVTNGVTLAPSLFTNSQTFYSPSITIPVTIAPGLFVNESLFFTPVVFDPFRDRMGRALNQPLMPIGHNLRRRFGRR